MRIGSLFSGYGGLDIGTTAAIPGSSIAWHAEIDKHAAAILHHHWPDIPNHGDITKVDWDTVEPVDVLTGGFPCQDVSAAGKRAGIKAGTRSGLWTIMAEAVDHLKPDLVIIENVRGLLSAEASSNVEPCPHCMGDNRGQPILRALGAVLGDLTDIGYDATWGTFRASDVGACHRRERVFIVAHPADTECSGRNGRAAQLGGASVNVAGNHPRTIAHTESPGPQRGGNVRSGSGQPAGTARRRGNAAADADGERHGGGQDPRRLGHVDGEDAGQAQQRQRAREIPSDRSATDGPTATGHSNRQHDASIQAWNQQEPEPDRARREMADWGPYADAIHRWEQVLGRPAPPPTEPGANNQPRLSPTFVEWMMGLPHGHVTNTGIPRTQQLKALGNGVVPQQATHAITSLLGASCPNV